MLEYGCENISPMERDHEMVISDYFVKYIIFYNVISIYSCLYFLL